LGSRTTEINAQLLEKALFKKHIHRRHRYQHCEEEILMVGSWYRLFLWALLLMFFVVPRTGYAVEGTVATITDKSGVETKVKSLGIFYKAPGQWVKPLQGKGADAPQTIEDFIGYVLITKEGEEEKYQVNRLPLKDIASIQLHWFDNDPERVRVASFKRKDGTSISITRESHSHGVVEIADALNAATKRISFLGYFFSPQVSPRLYLEKLVGEDLDSAGIRTTFQIKFSNVTSVVFE
jgi:hypothetical protein